jgi:CRISPR-associated protein Cmr4
MSEAHHQLFLLHALTPLHVGGDEGVGGIDLPTMREAHTGYPLLPGSSLKGVLREAAEIRHGVDSQDVRGAFGPPQAESGDFRGGLVFTDAHLLALPVRSLYGTFAWVSTAPALARFGRDLAVAGLGAALPALPEVRKRDAALVPAGAGSTFHSALVVDSAKATVFLDELAFQVQASPEVAALAGRLAGWLWPEAKDSQARDFFLQRFLVVHEDVFSFYSRLGLEVRSRVKIDRDTGTAADSGPWTEEHMPAETILAGLVVGRRTRVTPRRNPEERTRKGTDEGTDWIPEKSLDILRGLTSSGPIIRFGGHSTIGLGRARFRLAPSLEVAR